MSETEIIPRIVAFAPHLGQGWADGGEREARERFWLDEAGRPTPDGMALLMALEDQRRTRTAYRNV